MIPPGAPITTLVVDYGGVLTNPLLETYQSFAEDTGIPLETIAAAFAAATERHGATPMADLETGAISEEAMVARIAAELPPEVKGAGSAAELLGGRPFGELWFRGRTANPEMVALLRVVRATGRPVALLTNNVLEWRPRWRATLPVDELFDLVVDSSEEGVRKPDPEIYRRLLTRLGADPGRCLFVDDTAENLGPAAELGMHTLLFHNSAQAVKDVAVRLDLDPAAVEAALHAQADPQTGPQAGPPQAPKDPKESGR
ncbi:HAD family phosphatase [Streptomyces sp. DSM 44917]|uniref:HAD family phosphatase n=1 Tax=Streptomyces boetiae TaxID=3075541 RepID=A0ABU2L729_9ACTN|nr:HAD family phosphatase [Streptomyces sp. DSM 44917]MDT0307367.1 HAD family phosphatase [Streptomyces sp. DSM 44917]